MANDIPSTHKRGYWLASTPTSIPSHTYPAWLLDLLGRQYEGNPDEFVPPGNALQAPPTFPVPAGDNAQKRRQFNPLNALSMFGRY
jgi:hypothetical protein